MKRALHVILALAIVSMFMISPVAAATSQGLEWGIATGDSFDFTMAGDASGTEDDFSEGMYMNVTDMPALAIDDPLTSWATIPVPSLGMWWDNGTSIGIYIFVFLGLLIVGSRMVVPIGNYTHLTSLVTPVMTGEDVINTATVWGIEWTEETNSTHEMVVKAHFSKADGFLTEYSMNTVVSATDAVVESFSVTRDGGAPLDIVQLLQDNILYVAIGVGVLVVLAIVCKKK